MQKFVLSNTFAIFVALLQLTLIFSILAVPSVYVEILVSWPPDLWRGKWCEL